MTYEKYSKEGKKKCEDANKKSGKYISDALKINKLR